MMEERTVELTGSCKLVELRFETGAPMVSLDYTEHSPAHGYSDMETSVDIDEAKAREIIQFLREAFNLDAAPQIDKGG
jgi:hypothetical protein